MSGAREQILNKVRQAIGRSEIDDATRAELNTRIDQPPRHIRPRLGEDLVQRFCDQLAKGNGTVRRVSDPAALPDAVREHLTRHNLAARLVAAPALADQPWLTDLQNHIEIEFRATQGDDLVSLTPCFCAVAETGSVVLLSGPDSPTTLNFLPDDHLVVVHAEQILAHVEDAWAQFRTLVKTPPRAINFITGPSKTADVEQTLQIGAHGPRRLHVLLVD